MRLIPSSGIGCGFIAVTVVVIVTRNLTSNIDSRLSSSLSRIAADPFRSFPPQSFREPGGGPRFGPPLLIWVVQPSGAITGNDVTAALPAESRRMSPDILIARVEVEANRLRRVQDLNQYG